MNQFIAAEPDLRDDFAGFGIFGEGARALVSRRALEAVIGRAILDEEFRLALFADPEAALVEYELSKEERTALKSVDAENLDACANGPGRRIVSMLARVVPGAAT